MILTRSFSGTTMSHHVGIRLSLPLLALLGGACESQPGPLPEVEEARFEGSAIPEDQPWASALFRARETADALTTDLGGLVMSTLQEQGAVAAVDVCSTVAQQRTAAHAAEGVSVRRVSDRVRNPLNAPDAIEERELQMMARVLGQGDAPPEVVRIARSGDARTLQYLRPIVIAPPCLTCHGSPEEIAPEVAGILRQRYPQDRATGYRAGDLRGAVSVAVDLDPG
jgi:hypothetical protein